MFDILNTNEINLVSCAVRLLLAMILSGTIGMERGRKKRPAGLRTYMVVCIGSTIAMLTNQFIYQEIGAPDPSRIAAQVISGIGFLGAGTIIVTGHNQVKGLTTAAGLWASASLGLAVGVGFYTGAILGWFFLFLAMNMLHFVDKYITAKSKVMILYIELKELGNIRKMLEFSRGAGISISGIEINKDYSPDKEGVAVIATIAMSKRLKHADIIEQFSHVEGIVYIDEIA